MSLRHIALGFMLPAILLSSCFRGTESESGPSEQAEVKHVVSRFVEDLTSTGERNMQVYSVPFWADGHWVTTMEQLKKEIPHNSSGDFPGIKSLDLRLYPVNHLDVLFTSAWQRLQTSELPEQGLEGVYAVAIMIEIEGAAKAEQGWLLVRKVDGIWKIAGVIER
jgi:hypothetical protein